MSTKQQTYNFSKTSSGNTNRKQQQKKYKQIDLTNFQLKQQSQDIQTLKKPLKNLVSQLTKTNPKGINIQNNLEITRNWKQNNNNYDNNFNVKKNNWIHKESYTIIQSKNINIKPAYQATNQNKILNNLQYVDSDTHTIMSAFRKKGEKIIIKPNQPMIKTNLIPGPAEKKLKSLMKKQVKFTDTKIPQKQQKHNDIIEQQIIESIDQYGNQSFQKHSGSMIKEEIGGSSGIKQSIRQDIRQSIRQSIPMQSIADYKSHDRQQIKQSIRSIQESYKKSKDSVGQVYQQIYQQDFQQQSLNKSRSKSKKIKDQKKFDLSDSYSKGFRTKTAMKSIKINQQLNIKNIKLINQDKNNQLDNINKQINKQKLNLSSLKLKIQKLLKIKQNQKINYSKNSQLLLNLKIQLNKLLTSDKFQSKLKKLTSFLKLQKQSTHPQELQDKILQQCLKSIQNIKTPVISPSFDSIEKIRLEYQQKLKNELKIQQVNLRAEMNQKLSQQDSNLKKMMAELQQKMLSKAYPVKQSIYFNSNNNLREQQIEVNSDQSIASDDIQWKADLWELLPQYQKKKLYQRQANQVTKFLTSILLKEIKQQSLQRQLDISFQFPDDDSDSIKSSKSKISQSYTHANKEWANKKNQLPEILIKRNSQSSEISNSWHQQNQKIGYEGTKKDPSIKKIIIQTLHKYKDKLLKKKNEIIRKVVKILINEKKQPMSSIIQQIHILNQKQIQQKDKPYIQSYQQTIINQLINIYNRCNNRKSIFIEQQMKKNYDRLLVTCSLQTAQLCSEMITAANNDYKFKSINQKIKTFQRKPLPIEIIHTQSYINYKNNQHQKDIKNSVVNSIVELLSLQFSKQFPKRKKI